jgi:molybdenum cofactor cytidylyltransferase
MEPWSHRDTDFTDVWAIVLAAGRSTRMEAFKQLLPFGGRTVVEAAVWSLVRAGVGVERVIVVVGHRAEEVARVVQPLGARIATNREHDRGMLSSVQTGLASVPEGARAVLIALGDQPFGEPEVARAVVRSWRNSGRGLIVPSHDGRRGHPLLIDLKYRDAVAKLSPDVGLREILLGHPDDLQHVVVEVDSIARDMDTRADYEREVARLKGER